MERFVHAVLNRGTAYFGGEYRCAPFHDDLEFVYSMKSDSVVASLQHRRLKFITTQTTLLDRPFIEAFLRVLERHNLLAHPLTPGQLYQTLTYRVMLRDTKAKMKEPEEFDDLLTCLYICGK